MFELGDLCPISPGSLSEPDLQTLLVEELFGDHVIKGSLRIPRGFSFRRGRRAAGKVRSSSVMGVPLTLATTLPPVSEPLAGSFLAVQLLNRQARIKHKENKRADFFNNQCSQKLSHRKKGEDENTADCKKSPPAPEIIASSSWQS